MPVRRYRCPTCKTTIERYVERRAVDSLQICDAVFMVKTVELGCHTHEFVVPLEDARRVDPHVIGYELHVCNSILQLENTEC